MLQAVVSLAVAAHGVGHSVGFWVTVPRWFTVAWLVPGIGFAAGAWLLWRHDALAVPVIFASAAVSIGLELLSGDALKPGPLANAFVFNAVTLIVLIVPATRELVTKLS